MSNPSIKKVGGEIDRFNDNFHAQGDDIDENDDADIDFDQFFTNFDKNEEEPESKDIPWIHSIVEEQPEHLSQKLSQLATSNVETSLVATDTTTTTTVNITSPHQRPVLTPATSTTPAATATTTTTTTVTTVAPKKKFKHTELGKVTSSITAQQEQMPEYLSHTNKMFEEMIIPLLPQSTTTTTTANTMILIEELRQIAFLEHQLQKLNLDIALWTTYLQSGTGILKQTEAEKEDHRSLLQQLQYPRPTRPCIWPKKLKSIIMNDSNVNTQEKSILNHTTYLNYVNKILMEFQKQSLSYQKQIEEKRQCLKGNLTSEIEQKIVDFVEDYGLVLYRIVNEGFIAAVEYNYMDRLVELEFEREDTYREHILVFQTLTKGKTTTETAKMEVELLKQQVAHQQLSSLFDSFQIPIPTGLETIQDESIRQRLIYRYEQLIQRTKSEMMTIHIRTAEVKMDEQIKQFENDLQQFFHRQRTNYEGAKFNNKMLDIMDRRFKLVDERMKTLLDLKVRFFVKAPTVNRH